MNPVGCGSFRVTSLIRSWRADQADLGGGRVPAGSIAAAGDKCGRSISPDVRAPARQTSRVPVAWFYEDPSLLGIRIRSL